jgi:hypothetical protein
MVLGLYYLSIQAENEPGQGMVFSDMGELHHALESKVVTLHTKIKGRFKSVDADGNPTSKIYETTPGRMIIGELLPRNVNVSVRHLQPGDDQEEHLPDDRHRLPSLRSEGHGHFLRPHHGSSASAMPAAPAFPSARTTW